MDVNFATTHPDAHKLSVGEAPRSYKAVATSVAMLLRQYNNAEEEAAKMIKDLVFRVCAHCNSFVRGEVGGDIAVDEWFDLIKSAATEVMNLQPSQVHATAVKNGENRDLKIKTRPKKGPLQDKYVPYLQSSFVKEFNKIIAQDKYSFLDSDELKTVTMMLHSDYLDHRLRSESALDTVPGSTVTAPPNKDLGRALVKVFSDYHEEKNPPAHLLDAVRRSIVTSTLLAQENFIGTIIKMKDGKVKPFQLSRYKSTMPKADEPVKFTLINVVYTPSAKELGAKDTAGKPHPLTFTQMVADPVFSFLVAERQQRDGIGDLYFEAAREVLHHPRFKKHSIAMVIELQLYLAHFLERKKQVHAIYKCMRPTSAADLTRDLAKYATNKAMAYVAKEGQVNDSAKARLRRDMFDLKLLNRDTRLNTLGLGSFDSPNKSLYLTNSNSLLGMVVNFRGTNRLAPALSTIGKYCNAFDVEELYLGDLFMGVTGAARLAEAFKTNTSLTHLSLRRNIIGDDGVTLLAEALKTNMRLAFLCLDHNEIGTEGAAKLAEALKGKTSLTTLSLYTCQIGDEGVAKLAEALKTNTSLTNLNLARNNIKVEGAVHLAEALVKCTSLTYLNLMTNDIGDKGMAKLAEALKKNPSLTSLE